MNVRADIGRNDSLSLVLAVRLALILLVRELHRREHVVRKASCSTLVHREHHRHVARHHSQRLLVSRLSIRRLHQARKTRGRQSARHWEAKRLLLHELLGTSGRLIGRVSALVVQHLLLKRHLLREHTLIMLSHLLVEHHVVVRVVCTQDGRSLLRDGAVLRVSWLERVRKHARHHHCGEWVCRGRLFFLRFILCFLSLTISLLLLLLVRRPLLLISLFFRCPFSGFFFLALNALLVLPLLLGSHLT